MADIHIEYTKHFIKQLKKLSKDKQQQTIKAEKLFRKDPFTPRLKTHKLTGKLDELWAFSINYQDRVIFEFLTKEKVLFHRIGSHDIYKK